VTVLCSFREEELVWIHLH